MELCANMVSHPPNLPRQQSRVALGVHVLASRSIFDAFLVNIERITAQFR